MSDVTRSIQSVKGDIHHTFPYDYLKKNGKSDRYDYNQIANFVYMEKSTNIQIGNKSQAEYMNIVISQVKSGSLDSKTPNWQNHR